MRLSLSKVCHSTSRSWNDWNEPLTTSHQLTCVFVEPNTGPAANETSRLAQRCYQKRKWLPRLPTAERAAAVYEPSCNCKKPLPWSVPGHLACCRKDECRGKNTLGKAKHLMAAYGFLVLFLTLCVKWSLYWRAFWEEEYIYTSLYFKKNQLNELAETMYSTSIESPQPNLLPDVKICDF